MSYDAKSDPGAPLDQTMAKGIPLLLIVGVVLSALVLTTGLLMLLLTGQTGYHTILSPDLIVAREGNAVFPTTVGGVLQGVLNLKPFALIELGTLLLIATPVFRVGASIVLFLAERDYLYVLITLLVFIVLLISIFLIR